MSASPKIKNVLWFDSEAEAAAKHYMAAFADAELIHLERYGKAGPGPEGSVMVVEFALAGQRFVGLNGGPLFTPNESVSFLITCEDQAEVDRLWLHFSDGGQTGMCGWLKDRWGFSWQIAPKRFFDMMADGNAAQKSRVFAAMMQMTKFDVAALEEAWAKA
jgi:predicted 3-demethylubiquinone-9 3-methyltransferase (glyoxalase superfamily)